LTTAVEEGLTRRRPCHIRGGGQEHSDERPVIPISTLVELLGNVPARDPDLELRHESGQQRADDGADDGNRTAWWLRGQTH
jgi:hypothetical protein